MCTPKRRLDRQEGERELANQKITVEGQEVWVREEDFETAREEWNEYRLLDGGRIRVKAVVLKILRVVDEKGEPQFQPDGEPMFLVRNQVTVSASEGVNRS